MSRILKDDVNFGYEEYEGEIITHVNKTPVKNLTHLRELCEEENDSKYVVFTIEEQETVVIDKELAKKRENAIFKKFGIKRRTNLDKEDD